MADDQTVVFELVNVTNQTTYVSIDLPFTLDVDIAYYFWKDVNNNAVKVSYELSADGKRLSIALRDGVIDNDGLINERIVDSLIIPKRVPLESDVQVTYDGIQDLVFITILNASQVGSYGTYDYQVRIPSALAGLVGVTDSVARLDELN